MIMHYHFTPPVNSSKCAKIVTIWYWDNSSYNNYWCYTTWERYTVSFMWKKIIISRLETHTCISFSLSSYLKCTDYMHQSEGTAWDAVTHSKAEHCYPNNARNRTTAVVWLAQSSVGEAWRSDKWLRYVQPAPSRLNSWFLWLMISNQVGLL